MANAKGIQRENLMRIRRVLADGQAYTARAMADATGLSLSGCNLLLHQLHDHGEVIQTLCQTHEAGRRTAFYRISPRYGSMLCIAWTDGLLHARVDYLFGALRCTGTHPAPVLTADALLECIDHYRRQAGRILTVTLAGNEEAQSALAPALDGLGLPYRIIAAADLPEAANTEQLLEHLAARAQQTRWDVPLYP